MPPSRPSVSRTVWFHLRATCCNTRTASRVTSVPIPSPGRTRMLRFIWVEFFCQPLWVFQPSVGSRLLSLRVFNQGGDLFIQHALLAIRQRGEAMIQAIQLVAGQGKSEILAALVERVPPAVLAQHELAFRHAHTPRIDNLVGGFVLQVSVLMNARLVREGVPADDGFVRLRAKRDDRAEQLAG